MYNCWQDAGNRTRDAATAARCATNELHIFAFFLLTANLDQVGPSFINVFVQYSQSDLPPLRPLGVARGRDSNLGRAELVAETLTTRPPHLT